ncbi:hypothetical protein IWW36_003652 [Coemansia brasiliensis]|uniref:Uncharacterized protein n=1 Tax=Coemansia brasiliensis TaxID=2650707 RepID=A0A9W8I510_9FUNG|nr:hypothetical protein IWW36_003652 [Coemansia brasiliensis]
MAEEIESHMELFEFLDENKEAAVLYYDPEEEKNPKEICENIAILYPKVAFAYTLLPKDILAEYRDGKYVYKDKRPYFEFYKNNNVVDTPERTDYTMNEKEIVRLEDGDGLWEFIDSNTLAAIIYYDDEAQQVEICKDIKKLLPDDTALGFSKCKPDKKTLHSIGQSHLISQATYCIVYEDGKAIETPRQVELALQ